jgi:heme-degrading monooxygenase HmoA
VEKSAGGFEMFARIVTIPLKAGTSREFAKAIEDSVIPLLRKHKGFRDEIAFVRDDGNTSVGISFWDNKESAEAYHRSGFSDVIKALEAVAAGPSQVQLFEVTNSTAHKIAAAVGA